MAHRRKPLIRAFGANTLVLLLELVAGVASRSLSLLLDAAHNTSDEVALGFLVLAYSLRSGLSGRFLQAANALNSFGLAAICVLMSVRALERLAAPVEVAGAIPVVAGLMGALGNWGVARQLREPAREDAAIRLAYVHNLGDALLALAPVLAGVLVLATGQSLWDPGVAVVTAALILATTIRSVLDLRGELLWPQKVSCAHSATPADSA